MELEELVFSFEKYDYAIWVKVLHPKSKTVILTVSYEDDDGETKYDRQIERELKEGLKMRN